MAIQTPPGWIADQLDRAGHALASDTAEEYWHRHDNVPAMPIIRRVEAHDLWIALRRGMRDFGRSRTDVLFLCLFYPLAGLLIGHAASGERTIPLLFPLVSGFALIGPFAAIGLMEMSRLREERDVVGWADAFHVIHSPSLGAIILLGIMLLTIFGVWLGLADMIYKVTLGPDYPLSVSAFIQDTLNRPDGWAMIAIGIPTGFVLAVAVLASSVISFPLLLDRKLGAATAVVTSLRVVAANPDTMALWGLIVAVSLFAGALPLLLGLIVVMPVLGHAT